ncbi:MAG: D-glycero-beta-D-manno-heptose-7-phosphate kinase [Hyphomonadaceae bacterium]|nr:D-glycero-beta-D-manno-heptose-7-phosphate kinase [Hyphomonadaceae bacterium]
MSEIDAIARLKSARIAVLGDIMLDQHVQGQVRRVSDEAPVAVLHVQSERHTLGGAANVAANAVALGAEARLVGVVGDDSDGARLLRTLDETFRAITPHITVDRARPTVVKTRYLGGQQQMLRVDRERVAPCAPAIEDRLIEDLREAIDGAGALVLSDYGKGVLTDRVLAAAFAMARQAGVPVIVDPKRLTLADYRGADIITPNRRELSEAVRAAVESDAEAAAAAAVAIAQSGAAILLTRSEKGMSLFRNGADPIHLPAEAREVFDVSGAGDTVVAVIAAALGAGLPIERAMRLANAAAGVVVAKVGAATASPAELAAAMEGRERRATLVDALRAAPCASLDDARSQVAAWRARGLSVGFANGCFDLLHPGHVSLLAQAAGACDKLVVALNDDASVRRLKGAGRPIQPLESRARVIGALRGVDLVVAFGDDTPLALIEALQPDVLIKGADYREDEVVGAAEVKARGGRVVLAALIEGESTTAMARRAGIEGAGANTAADPL